MNTKEIDERAARLDEMKRQLTALLDMYEKPKPKTRWERFTGWMIDHPSLVIALVYVNTVLLVVLWHMIAGGLDVIARAVMP